jgi:hypothetical protein
MTPWRIQRYIWAECYSGDGAMQTLKDCPSPVSEAEALGAIGAFRESQDLTEDLRFWMVNNQNGLLLMNSIEADAMTLAQYIAGELER